MTADIEPGSRVIWHPADREPVRAEVLRLFSRNLVRIRYDGQEVTVMRRSLTRDLAVAEEPRPWSATSPAQFTDRRYIMGRTLSDGTERADTYRHVRAFRAVIWRRGDDGKPEYDRCPHAHPKPGHATKCAEKEARRRNKKEGR